MTPIDERMRKQYLRLSSAKREEWQERAGILEFSAGMSRRDAERRAWEIVVQSFRDHSPAGLMPPIARRPPRR